MTGSFSELLCMSSINPTLKKLQGTTRARLIYLVLRLAPFIDYPNTALGKIDLALHLVVNTWTACVPPTST